MKDDRMPSISASRLIPRRAAADQTERVTESDLNEQRLWRLLEHGSVTIRELREQGIKAPAQGLYALQLAGYVIDRLRVQDETGQPTLAYRLNRASEGFSEGRAAPESPRDHTLTTLHPAIAIEIH